MNIPQSNQTEPHPPPTTTDACVPLLAYQQCMEKHSPKPKNRGCPTCTPTEPALHQNVNSPSTNPTRSHHSHADEHPTVISNRTASPPTTTNVRVPLLACQQCMGKHSRKTKNRGAPSASHRTSPSSECEFPVKKSYQISLRLLSYNQERIHSQTTIQSNASIQNANRLPCLFPRSL